MPLTEQANVYGAIASARRSIMLARSTFDTAEAEEGAWGWEVDANIDVHLDDAFLRALTVAEAVGQSELRQLILADYKEGRGGFSKTAEDGDGDRFLPFLAKIEGYVGLLEDLYGLSSSRGPDPSLIAILRNCLYAITDKNCFQSPPTGEEQVHSRIEAVLRCVYPDLLHKPPLAKPIKGFVPDTGLPSAKTLIEYKFISRAERVSAIADEILADSRGYVANQWTRFVYVIYETVRFRPEHEWNALLFASGLGESSSVIVLQGESKDGAGDAKPVESKVANVENLSSGKDAAETIANA